MTGVFRVETGFRGKMMAAALRMAPAAFTLLRKVRPILRLGSLWVVTRYDDVVEVFATDQVFAAPYRENLDVITGGEPFFLGMTDGVAYREGVAAMRAVVRADDLEALGNEAERLATQRVAAANGRIDVVGLVRGTAFELIGRYFGIADPGDGRLAFLGSRLFEFQFTGSVKDAAWLAEAQSLSLELRDHIDRTIAVRKAMPVDSRPDDILSRCLALQAAGTSGYTDPQIRTSILCMIVGGPPQPPMVVPQGLDQLIRRPKWFAAARAAAVRSDDAALHDLLFEAMRFDPLAPGFRRMAQRDFVLAAGTSRSGTIKQGATVFAATASAMMDRRRVAAPADFDPHRPPHEYLHFGHGQHECFGRLINHATLHRMVKPLLAQANLKRAPGSAGKLEKRGAFAHRLEVVFG